MPKILFIGAHRPDRSPSQRFRIEQFLPYLEQNGYEYDYSWLLGEKDDKVFYSPGNLFRKFFIFSKSVVKRLGDVIRAGNYDIIFVQREAFMTGSVFFEKLFSKSSRLVFDFDDAIWRLDISDANKKLGWLKKPQKTSEIIAYSDLIIAGNDYLADYARQFNQSVKVIQTVIDTDKYRKVAVEKDDVITIGWTGSITTIKHLGIAVPVLKRIREKYGDKVRFVVSGDEQYVNEELGIKGTAWSSEKENEIVSHFDIGIMPLPDDEWSKGKCGLKGLQCMALEVPVVMSPVGVNNTIVRDGENGFLAASEDEWYEKIVKLIEDKNLRERLGKSGRKTVEENYSVNRWKAPLKKALDALL